MIAFSADEGLAGTHIYVVNINGSGLKQLTRGVEDDLFPSWDSSGRWVAFTSRRCTRRPAAARCGQFAPSTLDAVNAEWKGRQILLNSRPTG